MNDYQKNIPYLSELLISLQKDSYRTRSYHWKHCPVGKEVLPENYNFIQERCNMIVLPIADKQSLLGCLYDAVMAPTGFQEFIEKLCHAFQSKSVTMVTRNAVTHDTNGLWVYGATLDSYVQEYSSEDMLAQHILTEPIALFYASNLDVPFPENFPFTRF